MNSYLSNKNTVAIRVLAADAVQQANSGHPGAPMGMAELAEVLWREHLVHNPQNPHWINRDRFVLSNGHGSMLIYALLHLSGYDLPIEEIKNFRQLHSKTPGHPEYGITPGIETTTGPLGQGLANAVGMALAEKLLADEFNEPNAKVIDHHTYVYSGDGCLMEGISHEVCSLAGTLKLGKLIMIYDDNGISIDGEVKHWFMDDTTKRFEAYGWQTISVDGHDRAAISQAIKSAKENTDQPTIILAKTVIGAGSPNKAGGHGVHGAPLGGDEIAEMRKALNWEHPPFVIPDDVYQAWDCKKKGGQAQEKWQSMFDDYKKRNSDKANELLRRSEGKLPENWTSSVAAMTKEIAQNQTNVATRKASQICIGKLAPLATELMGGSADLTGSNLTNWANSGEVRAGQSGGRHINYGVREFGMAAIMNGMALHGGFIPFGGTFLTFSDYSRNAIRMAALMKIGIIHIFTHDSIGLGEDGPTHQAVEHVAALRLIPNLHVWRPADTLETMVAWSSAVENRTAPAAIILTRQGLKPIDNDPARATKIAKGAYETSSVSNPQIQILATGSEVEIAMEAQQKLQSENISAKVVSVPCVEVFQAQDKAYKDSVIDKQLPTLVIEAGIGDSWHKLTGAKTELVCMETFGESAPAKQLYEYFGLTSDNLVKKAKALL